MLSPWAKYSQNNCNDIWAEYIGPLSIIVLISWQVIVDVPRTAPGVPFFAQKQLQKSLERILFLWGIRYCAALQLTHCANSTLHEALIASPFFCACHIIPHIYVAHIVRQFVPTQESPLHPGMLAFPSPACAVSDRAEAIMACRRCVACHGCRHPASGYVQGINDLVTPFLAVFLSPHMEGSVEDQTDTDFPEEVPPVSRLSPHSSCSQHAWSLLPFRGKAPESSNSQGGCTVSACFRHCCQWHVWSAVISSRTACLQASMLQWHSLHAVVVSKLFSVCR